MCTIQAAIKAKSVIASNVKPLVPIKDFFENLPKTEASLRIWVTSSWRDIPSKTGNLFSKFEHSVLDKYQL